MRSNEGRREDTERSRECVLCTMYILQGSSSFLSVGPFSVQTILELLFILCKFVLDGFSLVSLNLCPHI